MAEKYTLLKSFAHYMSGMIAGLTLFEDCAISYAITLLFLLYQLLDMFLVGDFEIKLADPLDKELVEFAFGYMSGVIVYSIAPGLIGVNIGEMLIEYVHKVIG